LPLESSHEFERDIDLFWGPAPPGVLPETRLARLEG
jgi:hypothetical protein